MRILRYLYKNLENVIAAVLILLMIVFLSVQVITRYVFSSPVAWAEELTKICFIMSVFFGTVGAWHRNQHLALSSLVEKLSPKGKCYLRLVTDVLSIAFCVVILPAMFTLVDSNMKTGMSLPVTQFPKWIFYLCMPVTFVMLIFRIIQEIIAIVKAIKNGTYTYSMTESVENEENRG